MSKKILVSCGPIPGKMDERNYILNGSDGQSAYRTVSSLKADNDITIIKWKNSPVDDSIGQIPVVEVDSVYDYYDYVSTHRFDVYILAAEIPYWGCSIPNPDKKAPIEFHPSPRTIDIVKQKWPDSILIGYKSFDGHGTENQFINEGFPILFNAHATCIISLDSITTDNKKIILLPDASVHYFGWDDHIQMIKRIINLKKYTTEKYPMTEITDQTKAELQSLLDQIKVEKYGYVFGTVALKYGGNIISTTRGKRGSYWGKVMSVDHSKYKVSGDEMTPNIPMMDLLYKTVPGYAVILHGHEFLEDQMESAVLDLPYYFDGTSETLDIVKMIGSKDRFLYVKDHGYYAMFENTYAAQKWLNGRQDRKH